jgi:hypothetical protein
MLTQNQLRKFVIEFFSGWGVKFDMKKFELTKFELKKFEMTKIEIIKCEIIFELS